MPDFRSQKDHSPFTEGEKIKPKAPVKHAGASPQQNKAFVVDQKIQFSDNTPNRAQFESTVPRTTISKDSGSPGTYPKKSAPTEKDPFTEKQNTGRELFDQPNPNRTEFVEPDKGKDRKNTGIEKAPAVSSSNAFIKTKFPQNEENPFDNGINNPEFKKEEKQSEFTQKYIYWDHKNMDGSSSFNPAEGHEKIAEAEQHFDMAGGTHTYAEFTNNGKLKSDIFLDKYKSNGFREKSAEIFDSGADVKGTVDDMGENSASASNMDDMEILLLRRGEKRDLREADRYQTAAKEFRREEKQLKKESDKEQKNISDSPKASEISNDVEFSKGVYAAEFKTGRADFKDHAGDFRRKDKTADNTAVFKASAENSVHKNTPEKEKSDSITTDDGKKTLMVEAAVSGLRRKNRPQADTSHVFANGQENTVTTTDANGFIRTRAMTSQEKLAQAKSNRKGAKKGRRKEMKKAASKAAFRRTLMVKKNVQNEAGNMVFQSSGDLMKDGSGVLKGFIGDPLKQLAQVLAKKLLSLMLKLGALIAGLIMQIITLLLPLIPLFLVVLIPVVVVAYVGDSGEENYDPNDVLFPDHQTGQTVSYMSTDDIYSFLGDDLEMYGEERFTSERLNICFFAMSKIGCAYNQDSHWNHDDNVYDCSELAYCAYQYAGIDISNNGLFSAAEECRAQCLKNNYVSGELLPGDLIFYGGSDNDRYMGVYHVAVYIGQGYMVEARNEHMGVVLSDVRTKNVVMYARPTL